MRLFIAVDIPEQLLDFAARAMVRLKKTGADVKWVAPEHMHFTLHFLGEVAAGRLDAAAGALAAAEGMGSFALEPAGFGFFGAPKSPRVIWLGLKRGARELEGLRAAIGKKLDESCFETDARPFEAHLTLGRSRGPRGMAELSSLLSRTADLSGAVSCAAESVTLYKSELLPTGPCHSVLKRVSLGVDK
jgi:2'-5' RNA ligase